MARRAFGYFVGGVEEEEEEEEEEKGPTFFKIIKPGFNTEHLRIPPAFRKHVSQELTTRATLKLKNSSDSSWTVKVSKIGRDIFLKEGWEEFLRDNNLGDSEFLVFKYDKHMCFIINVFDKNCIERVKIAGLRTRQASTCWDNTKRPTGNRQRDLATRSAEELRNKGRHLPSYAAAAAFKSNYPYFAKVIPGSKMLAIPTHFYKEIFSLSKYKRVILKTSKGKMSVSLRPQTDTVAFSSGWSYFRHVNRLEVDDICIFELVKANTMVVHIFRNRTVF